MEQPYTINYFREAFLHPANLGYLLMITLLAYASAEWATWMPTLLITVGLGIELIYLGMVPRMHRFRNRIGLLHQPDPGNPEYEKHCFDQLNRLHQKRFLALKHIKGKIRDNFNRVPDTSRPLTDHLMRRLDELAADYLHQLQQLERFDEHLRNASPESLAVEVQVLEKEMASATSDRLRTVMQRRLEILKMRRDKFRMAREKAQICSSQLDTVADIFNYIYEKSVVLGSGDTRDRHLDLLMSELEDTAAMIQDIEDDLPPTYTVLKNMESQVP